MIHRATTATIMFVVTQLALSSGAFAKVDKMRCEAKLMRNESRLYDCLSRCDHTTQLVKKSSPTTSPWPRCAAGCEDRARNRREKIEKQPPCSEIPVTPDPYACRARYLQLGAKEMMCKAQCETDVACEKECHTTYETDLDELRAKPICKDGWAPSDKLPESF